MLKRLDAILIEYASFQEFILVSRAFGRSTKVGLFRLNLPHLSTYLIISISSCIADDIREDGYLFKEIISKSRSGFHFP